MLILFTLVLYKKNLKTNTVHAYSINNQMKFPPPSKKRENPTPEQTWQKVIIAPTRRGLDKRDLTV